MGFHVVTYDASYGGVLGSGAPCTAAPEIVQGTVYAVSNELSASTLGGAVTTSAGRLRAHRPDPRRLRASARRHRLFARHHRRHRHVLGAALRRA